NQEYIKSADMTHLIGQLDWHLDSQAIDVSSGPDITKVVDALRERSKTLFEMAQSMKMFYQDFDQFDEKAANKQFKPAAEPIIKALIDHYSQLEDWSSVAIHDVVKTVCDEQGVGFGKVGQPFRLALSGTGNAGSIDVVAELVGKDRTLARLKLALDYIAQIDN
ncbi:MAG: glutamate--tRNA ligase, partial [Candidatus Thioglobus sp.]